LIDLTDTPRWNFRDVDEVGRRSRNWGLRNSRDPENRLGTGSAANTPRSKNPSRSKAGDTESLPCTGHGAVHCQIARNYHCQHRARRIYKSDGLQTMPATQFVPFLASVGGAAMPSPNPTRMKPCSPHFAFQLLATCQYSPPVSGSTPQPNTRKT